MIEIKQVTKTYPNSQSPAVAGLSLNIEQGEILVLLGPSGCGKTTTLRLIAGFEEPDQGEILIRGAVVAAPGSFVPPDRRRIGMVFQDYALFPHLSVRDNVLFGIKRLSKEEKEERLHRVLELVGLKARENYFPHQISGGQQQRVALARALATEPDLILLDEPLSNLDADLRVRMRSELDVMLRKAGVTAVMVTHDQEDAFSLADRVAVLNEGRLEQVGTPEQIYHEPATFFVADFVGQADFVSGVLTEGGADTPFGFVPIEPSFDKGVHVKLMVRPDDVVLESDADGGSHIIERRFRGSDIVYQVSLPTGEVVQSIQASNIDYPAGAAVRASIRPIHIVLLNKDTGEIFSCRHQFPPARGSVLNDRVAR